MIAFDVAAEDDGATLDCVLAARISDLTRRRARMLVEIGAVRVDGAIAARRDGGDASVAVRAGQRVEARLGGALDRATQIVSVGSRAVASAEAPTLRVVFEDEDVCVVDKPSGLVTTCPEDVERPSVVRTLEKRPGSPRMWVVQRLDAATSGLLVLAKNAASNRGLAGQLSRHETEREYEAFVRGAVAWEARTIEEPLRGRRAVTRVAVTERFGHLVTGVTCRLETGRTHQIRLHLARAGHPLCGDPRHGQRAFWDTPRLALHARRLGFVHPSTGATMRFESPLPGDLAAWLETLREMREELGDA